MTEHENVEETVMLTRRDRRRAAASASPDASRPNGSDTTDDADAPDAGLGAADEAVASESEAVASEDEAVASEDEATIVVDRSTHGASDPVEDQTVVVARPPRRSRRRGETAAEQDLPDPGSADAQPSAPAPAEAGTEAGTDAEAEPFARPAVPEPAIYKPRPAPLGPSAPPVVVGGAPPTRVSDPERVSVAKRSRRWSTLTLAVFAAACAVSVAGLVGVGFLVFG